MRSTLLILGLFVMPKLGFSYPTHMFWCSVQSVQPARQVYIEIEDNDVRSGVGKVIVSEMSTNGSGWNSVQQADVSMNIRWGVYRGQKAILGVDVDMGRSGMISADATEAYNKYKGNYSGLWGATLGRL